MKKTYTPLRVLVLGSTKLESTNDFSVRFKDGGETEQITAKLLIPNTKGEVNSVALKAKVKQKVEEEKNIQLLLAQKGTDKSLTQFVKERNPGIVVLEYEGTNLSKDVAYQLIKQYAEANSRTLATADTSNHVEVAEGATA